VLPRWLGVKYLKVDDSKAYQAFALTLAGRMGVTRVHLDTYLWVEGRRVKRPGAD
jgi:hypothetical protein